MNNLSQNQIEELVIFYYAQKERLQSGVEGVAQVAKAISLYLDQPFAVGVGILAEIQQMEESVIA